MDQIFQTDPSLPEFEGMSANAILMTSSYIQKWIWTVLVDEQLFHLVQLTYSLIRCFMDQTIQFDRGLESRLVTDFLRCYLRLNSQ